jgi:HK97 family phage prohead protease
MLGTPEWRGFDQFEVRSQGHEFIVRGYASLFDVDYPVMGGPAAGGWTERVDRSAFDRTLAQKPDVNFLINHQGVSLARTKSGTLRLGTDAKGLETEARIDRRDPEGAALEVRMDRGDLDEMSIGFRTIRHEWPGDVRTLLEIDLQKGDVSVVNYGANDHTRIQIVPALEALSAMTVGEFRSMDNPLEKLREARAHLDRLIAEATPKASNVLSIDDALAILEGRA